MHKSSILFAVLCAGSIAIYEVGAECNSLGCGLVGYFCTASDCITDFEPVRSFFGKGLCTGGCECCVPKKEADCANKGGFCIETQFLPVEILEKIDADCPEDMSCVQHTFYRSCTVNNGMCREACETGEVAKGNCTEGEIPFLCCVSDSLQKCKDKNGICSRGSSCLDGDLELKDSGCTGGRCCASKNILAVTCKSVGGECRENKDGNLNCPSGETGLKTPFGVNLCTEGSSCCVSREQVSCANFGGACLASNPNSDLNLEIPDKNCPNDKPLCLQSKAFKDCMDSNGACRPDGCLTGEFPLNGKECPGKGSVCCVSQKLESCVNNGNQCRFVKKGRRCPGGANSGDGKCEGKNLKCCELPEQ